MPVSDRSPPIRLGFNNTHFASFLSFFSILYTYFECRLYKEACANPNWVNTINDDLTTLAKTQTWARF